MLVGLFIPVEEQEFFQALYKLKGYKREREVHDNGKFNLCHFPLQGRSVSTLLCNLQLSYIKVAMNISIALSSGRFNHCVEHR